MAASEGRGEQNWSVSSTGREKTEINNQSTGEKKAALDVSYGEVIIAAPVNEESFRANGHFKIGFTGLVGSWNGRHHLYAV